MKIQTQRALVERKQAVAHFVRHNFIFRIAILPLTLVKISVRCAKWLWSVA